MKIDNNIKILEISPKWHRIHQMPDFLYQFLCRTMSIQHLCGFGKNLSDIIEKSPDYVRRYIKSEKKQYKKLKWRGVGFKRIIIDEITKL